MILAFYLSMPNCASWNGKWSGDGRKFVIVKTFRGKKATEKAEKIRDTGYYHYSWPDGWGAGITVKEIDSRQAVRLRRESEGFCGYDWMVESIIKYGEPLADHQIDAFIERQNAASS